MLPTKRKHVDALPTFGVWQSYGRMPEESEYIMKGDGKCFEMCHK